MDRRWISAAILAASCATLGCGGGTNPTGTTPIITITNNWLDSTDPNHTFFFQSQDDGGKSGAFQGQESLGGSQFDLTGSWGGGAIQFTTNRTTPVTYRGSFTRNEPDTLAFFSSSGNLVLVRNVSPASRRVGSAPSAISPDTAGPSAGDGP